MGNFLSRSSSVRPEGTKTRWRKRKRKRLEEMETSMEGDKFLVQNENPPKNTTDNYEEWNKRIDQQQISNINGDPPGAPRTDSNNYPLIQNDLMSQSWSTSHDMNNQFYPGIPLSITTATANMSYDPNQYMHNNLFLNQPQSLPLEERSSKKVQFAHPIQQQITSSNPLTSTQSWHETNVTSNDVSTSTARHEPVISRQHVHHPIATQKTNTSLAPASVEKPIYVGIDHRATLAERGQTTATKRHHKNNDKTNSTTTSSHRSRTHHNKHRESSDSSTSKNNLPSNKSFEPLQGTTSGTHRTLTTTSTSTVIPNKQMQHIEQPVISDNDSKKTRNNRHSQSQHREQQLLVDNDIKLMKNRGNSSQQKQHQRTVVNRNNSPVRTEAVRRVETKQQNAPTINIPISQSQQRQKPSAITPIANITRTRV